MRRLFSVTAFALLLTSTVNATSPTPVVNVNDPTLHPYQVTALTSCTVAGNCALVFPAITTTRTLILRASCFVSLPTSTTIASANVPNNLTINLLPIFMYSSFNGVARVGINSDTYLFYTKGQQPRVDVFADTAPVGSLRCTLTGYHN